MMNSTEVGRARFDAKRQAGISPVRRDGSVATATNDEESAAAEEYAAQELGANFNTEIYTHGDGGKDFDISVIATKPWRVKVSAVEVVWLGRDKNSGKPRQKGNLIVNPDEPQRWAGIYVVVKGGLDEGFELCGWTTHKLLQKEPLRDFGFGNKFAMSVDKLRPMDELRERARIAARYTELTKKGKHP